MVSHKKQILILPILASLLLHLLVFDICWKINNLLSKDGSKSINYSNRYLEVKKISPEEIKKLKTVGIKNGNDHFSTKTTFFSRQNQKATSTKFPALEHLALKHLKNLKANAAKMIKKQNLEKEPLEKSVEMANTADYKRLDNFAFSNTDAQIMNSSDMNIKLDPPTGVSEDELNSMEKIYYSFQKRTYESYVNSFISTYNNIIKNHPATRLAFINHSHQLTGKITFDKEGNIVSIKVIQWSKNDDVQKVFEDTLKRIGTLPNPPKNLVNNGIFSIYYDLKINL